MKVEAAMAKVGTRAALLFGCILAIGAGCSVSRGIPGGSPTTAGVERVILDQTPNPSDPGQILELTRVTIGPGTCIPPHTHPGPQLGTLVAGTLSYRIIDGEAYVRRNAARDDAPGETLRADQRLELRTGDSIHEPPGMVHTATNEGDEPVVIYVSSLFPAGEPTYIAADEEAATGATPPSCP
jgi:quercetin dioxygenase-like cupin family protein